MDTIEQPKTKQALRDQIRATIALAANVETWCGRLPPDTLLPVQCMPALRQLALALLAFHVNRHPCIRLALLDTIDEALTRIVWIAEASGLPPMAETA